MKTQTKTKKKTKKIITKKIVKKTKAVKRARPRARVKPRISRKRVVRKTTPRVRKARPNALVKLLAVILMVSLNSVGLSGVGYTMGYYGDTEDSSDNAFTAGMLDFRLSISTYSTLIGPEALGEKTGVTVALPEDGSFPMQYEVSATTSAPAVDPLCSELTVEAKRNGITVYNGAFPDLSAATSTEFGTWEFRFDLPPLAPVPHGAICSLDALFGAWRADTAMSEESGYTDEELFSFSFTARMVVLNEVFANPGAGDKEFIEIYNNGNADVDVAGWKLSEISGSSEKFYTISPTAGSLKATSESGSTIVPANGFLVLYLSDGTALNNSGDTVRLYDDAATLLDSHAYPSTPSGKAHVRFPDGIGFWVDPEPTPGGENKVSIEDLRAAGFDEETIDMLLELAALMGTELTKESAPPPTAPEVQASSAPASNGQVVTAGEDPVEPAEEMPTVEESVPSASAEEVEAVAPEPEAVVPEVVQEIVPEVTPEVVTEIAPEVIPEVPPEPVVTEEPAIIPEEPI